MWADVPYSMEIRLEVDDKSNSGGIAVDAIRAVKIGLDRGIGGSLDSASSYLMKHPRVQFRDGDAKKNFEDFINDKREN
jgi:myo-inositol-1-phosphate synthase